MLVLLRWSWWLLAYMVHSGMPDAFDGWEWVGFYSFCGLLGEIGSRWTTMIVIGEHLEERDGARTKQLIQRQALTEELDDTRRELRSRKRETNKIGELQYQLSQTKTALRKARQYLDQMSDYFGPMPDKTGKR